MKTDKTADKAEERTAEYTLKDVGCYVDSARGIYAIDKILSFARSHGANIYTDDFEGSVADYEFVNEVEDECDRWMNQNFDVEGAYWGRNENSDWGLWEDETSD